MRILHTSDWHLGKNLEGFSRLDEQEEFLQEFTKLVNEKNIDMVIIAGDIYDTGNPPARAERLFYSTVKEISDQGRRPVLVIAGNHDNPERLSAASPLAYDHGIIILGLPGSSAEVGEYKGFKIIDSGEGFVEMEIKGEKAVILTLPYPSEKRLNEVFTEELGEEERQQSYSERINAIFSRLSEKYRDDTVNIAVSHIYITGGQGTDSERPIQLGGSLAVDECCLPKRAQYIALGHLHRPQRVSSELNAYYAGSPIQYSKSEINYSKCSYIVDVKAGGEANVEEVLFKNYKPIEVFECSSIEDAINKCRENAGRKIWAYFDIETNRVLTQSEIKEMKELIPDIVEIVPKMKDVDMEVAADSDMRNKSMLELFREFYKDQRKAEASEELTDLFLDIAKEDDGDEA